MYSYLLQFLRNCSSNLQRNLKEIQKKGNNSSNKQFFKNLRKPFLDSHMRNVVPNFRSYRLNGVAKIAITQTHIYNRHNKKPGHFWAKMFRVKFCLPPGDLCQKKIRSYLLWFLRDRSSKLQRNHKEIQKKSITQQKNKISKI